MLFTNETVRTIEIPIQSFLNNIETVNVAMVYYKWQVTQQKDVTAYPGHKYMTAFTTNLTKNDVYIIVEGNSQRMYPEGCTE